MSVRIVAVADCPQPVSTEVELICPSEGAPATLRTMRPTHFDKICIVVIDEKSKPPRPSSRKIACHVYEAARRAAPAVRRSSPVLDLRRVYSRNFSHLIVEIIPLCLHARGSLPNVSFALHGFGDDAKCRALLSLLNISPLLTPRTIAAPIVHIRGTRGLSAYDVQDTFDCPNLAFFPETYAGFDVPTTLCHEKIFLSRRGARSLQNAQAVEASLASHGYITVFMEDYTVPEQISLAANAQHVVAIHGAAMALLAFNPKLLSLVEIFPPHVYHEHFSVALGQRVKRHAIVIPVFDACVIHRGWSTIWGLKNEPFSVSPELVERALEAVSQSA